MAFDTIEIDQVKTKKDLKDFIRLPWKIYKNDLISQVLTFTLFLCVSVVKHISALRL